MNLVEKPWGREIWGAHTDRYAFKIIEINQGTRSSLQYHVNKHEHIYVDRGVLRMEWENDQGQMETRVLHPGDVIENRPLTRVARRSRTGTGRSWGGQPARLHGIRSIGGES